MLGRGPSTNPEVVLFFDSVVFVYRRLLSSSSETFYSWAITDGGQALLRTVVRDDLLLSDGFYWVSMVPLEIRRVLTAAVADYV